MYDSIFLFFLKPCEFFRPYTTQSLVCGCVWGPFLQAGWTGSIPQPTSLYQGRTKQRYGDSFMLNILAAGFVHLLIKIQYDVYGTENSHSSGQHAINA